MQETWACLTVGHPCRVSGYIPLGKHPRLFWYTKLLEDTAPNAVYNQGNGYDILNDKTLVFLLTIDPRNLPACVFFRELGYQQPLIAPPAVSPPALLLFDKEVNSELEGESSCGLWVAVLSTCTHCCSSCLSTSLFISIRWKIQCQPELQWGALCWVWAAGLQEEEGKSCSDWACSVIQPSCPSGFLRLGSVWWSWGEGWMAQTRVPHKGRDIVSEETRWFPMNVLCQKFDTKIFEILIN